MNTKYLVALLSFALCSVSSVRAETLEWIQQLGTSQQHDASSGVSPDGLGNVYISGRTRGNLGGITAGGEDAFLAKYDASGTLEWTQQFGTSEGDRGYGVSVDGLGSVYLSGVTAGSLEGTNAGDYDAFIRKYDASGTLEWTQQLGTSGRDWNYDASADGLGSVYISGSTEGNLGGDYAGEADAFLAKYDASGTLQWTQQLGTDSEEQCHGVSADGLGSVYISGYTGGNLGGETNTGDYDSFLAKYDASGTLEWTRLLGNSLDERENKLVRVSADGLGSVYITGNTRVNLEGNNAGGTDAFVSKYDASGTLEWIRQFGTSDHERGLDVWADGLGNVYISGGTFGSLGGTNAGDADAFIRKYDASGTLQWTQQIGTSEYDVSYGVSADGLGSVYMSGTIHGPVGGSGFVSRGDAFLAKFADPLLGDVNLDGEVNGLDVDPFVDVLLSGPYQLEADMNADQVVNGLDVDPFVAAVVGGTQPIPEPSTLLLTLVALGVVAGWRKWGG